MTRNRDAEYNFRGLWRDTCEGVGLARIVRVAAGTTASIPHVGGVRVDEDGHVVSATIQRHPGQTLAQYRKAAPLIADAFGAARVAFTEMGAERWMRMSLLAVDPLAASGTWRPDLVDGFIVQTEEGASFSAPWQRRPHTIAQGQTGAGKSSWTYGQLAQLAGRRDVHVVGVDPTGLLWRPWPDDPWRVSGLAGSELAEQRRVLRELVAMMDKRLATMPDGCDNLITDEDTPCIAVVLEEYAGLIRAAELAGKAVVAEVRGLVSRLLAEGRKVGIRVLIILQRAEAATVDALVRAQCGLRISFSVDSPEALAMLHPRDAADATEHATAEPGICIVTAPSVGTFRCRALYVSYSAYTAAVKGASS